MGMAKKKFESTADRDLEIYELARDTVEGELNRVKAELEELKAALPAIREESQVLGMIRKIDHDRAYNQLLKYTAMARLKERKDYRNLSMTWEQFCEAIGEPTRTVDQTLNDLQPLLEEFSAGYAGLPGLYGLSFNKIKYLGRSISAGSAEIEGDALVVDGIKIPLKPENKEEIEGLIDNLKETHKKEKTELEKRADLDKKQLERGHKEREKSWGIEKKGFLEEIQRLEVFSPEEKDHTWCEEQAREIEKACMDFVVLCQKFVVDERIVDDRVLQAQANKWIEMAVGALSDLRQRFNEMYFSQLD
jgi:hypothetical protein